MKTLIRLPLWGILASSIFFTGCASIVEGTHQSISVETPPVSNASCVLKNNIGQWYIKKTPGSTLVHQSIQSLIIRCKKPHYRTAVKKVESHTKGMILGNIFFGGVIGAGVDVADGAAYHYPTHIKIPMHRK